jgi:hypothetical protein
MTITAAVPTYVQFQGNGSATIFSAPMKCFSAADVVVTFIVDGVPTLQSLGFAVTNVDVNGGFSVVFSTPPPVGTTVDIRTLTAQTQTTEFANLGDYLPENSTESFDRVTRIVQDLFRLVYQFGIHGPDNEATPWPPLPGAAARANNYVAFDSNGKLTIAALIANALTQTTFNSFYSNVRLFPQTAAEALASITPTSYSLGAGQALRYGIDLTGLTDSTIALRTLINASWAGLLYASPWNGFGGGSMIPTLPPGRYNISSTVLLPCNITFTGQAHPGGNTQSHTRVILNSTGVTPARHWTASTVMPAAARTQPSVSNGYFYQAEIAFPAGTTGTTEPVWPTNIGSTVTDGSGITWTCVAQCTTGDNRNTPMFKFSRAVSPSTYPSGGTLADGNMNATVANLEFWGVTPGGTFDNPLSSSNTLGDYPGGGVFYVDVATNDFRIVGCNFQNTPCGIRINNVPQSSSLQGDGFVSGGIVNIEFEGCEFDAAGAHVWATNANLALRFRGCKFYGGVHRYFQCTGSVVYDDACEFQGNSYIDAGDLSNSWSEFLVGAKAFQQCGIFPSVAISNCPMPKVSGCAFFGASSTSTIVLRQCTGGQVTNVAINDSGFNAQSGTGIADFVAAVKLIDCQNVLVSDVNITATDAAAYNGFGVLTGSLVGTSANNFVTGVCVSATYNGAAFNGQDRYINIATGDYKGLNFDAHSPAGIQIAEPVSGYGAPTGNTIVANFPGATATLVQTSQTVAQIITALQAAGIIRA